LLAGEAGKNAPPPLHQRIDELIEEGNVADPVALAGDAEFLRRVWLDFVGTIPSAEEARNFLADKDPDKRTKVVDRLLASDEFNEHMAITLDVWLMERRRAVHVKDVEWRNYLRESIAANKSWLELSKEILTADGSDAKNRAASRFYLDREGEPNLISRDVGRLLFGQDLQCAQCHDHPQISDYLQRDYHGLFAFFGRSYLFQPDKKKPAVLAEKALGGGEFKSVFTDVEDTSLPRLLHGDEEIADPVLPVGEEYKVAPDPKDKQLQPIPKYSRRAQISAALGDGENPAFRRNIANRLWAHLMGRGLVEPFDFHHASNPPSHPQLLDLLADEFAAMDFDLRKFLRELALTGTYQRQFEMPTQLTDRAGQVKSKIDALKVEEQRLAELSRAAADKLDAGKEAWNAVRLAAAPSESALAVAEKKYATAVGAKTKALAALETDKAELEKLATPASAAATATTTSEEKKPDPKVAKLEAAVAAKQKALDTAESAVAAAAAEVNKLKPAADAERKKTLAATDALEAARGEYQQKKTEWKLAQRRLRDAEDLITYHQKLNEAAPNLAQADQMKQELAKVTSVAEARRKLAGDLKSAADSAQAAREQLSDDEDLVMAAAVLGERSAKAQVAAAAAEKELAVVREKTNNAVTVAEKLREETAANLESLTDRWADAFAIGSFTQLTPEQLSHAMLRASGQWDRLVLAGESAFDKKLAEQKAAKEKPAPKPAAKDAKAKSTPEKKPEPPLTEADRKTFVADYLRTQVEAQTNRFVALFGAQAGSPQSDFFATADQALFLENDGTVRAWLRPSGENLGGRLLKLENAEDVANELYLSILTREPDDVERAAVAEYLAARSDNKSAAVQDLSWALLSSVEFRFKH
jgi:hypothetical protein